MDQRSWVYRVFKQGYVVSIDSFMGMKLSITFMSHNTSRTVSLLEERLLRTHTHILQLKRPVFGFWTNLIKSKWHWLSKTFGFNVNVLQYPHIMLYITKYSWFMHKAASIPICTSRGLGHTKGEEEAGSSKALQGKKYRLYIIWAFVSCLRIFFM